MRTVLVCGGREYGKGHGSALALATLLTTLHRADLFRLLVTGGASGADQAAEAWASDNGIPHCVFPALWGFHKKAAGPIRNATMLEFINVDLVIAFPGGKGTANMIRLAQRQEIEVHEVSDYGTIDEV